MKTLKKKKTRGGRNSRVQCPPERRVGIAHSEDTKKGGAQMKQQKKMGIQKLRSPAKDHPPNAPSQEKKKPEGKKKAGKRKIIVSCKSGS